MLGSLPEPERWRPHPEASPACRRKQHPRKKTARTLSTGRHTQGTSPNRAGCSSLPRATPRHTNRPTDDAAQGGSEDSKASSRFSKDPSKIPHWQVPKTRPKSPRSKDPSKITQVQRPVENHPGPKTRPGSSSLKTRPKWTPQVPTSKDSSRDFCKSILLLYRLQLFSKTLQILPYSRLHNQPTVPRFQVLRVILCYLRAPSLATGSEI